MHRSELTIDLAALRRNARTLLAALAGSELWAVVKANGYGHGATQAAGAAPGAGATGPCVAAGPPEARYRDGTLGVVGASGATVRGRRPDEPPRNRGYRCRVRGVADRALP